MYSSQRTELNTASQQRFLSLFLRSEREIFRYVAALVPNLTDAEDIVQQTDTAHEWQSWRRSLREIAPLLFKN
jgi:RNA polymerase sigma-70 factor, ECF subfamily